MNETTCVQTGLECCCASACCWRPCSFVRRERQAAKASISSYNSIRVAWRVSSPNSNSRYWPPGVPCDIYIRKQLETVHENRSLHGPSCCWGRRKNVGLVRVAGPAFPRSHVFSGFANSNDIMLAAPPGRSDVEAPIRSSIGRDRQSEDGGRHVLNRYNIRHQRRP